MAHLRRYQLEPKGGNNSKKGGFSFDHLCRNNTWSLFGFQSSSSSNSYVPAMSCHNLVRSFDASCWPKTCGDKKVKWLSVFKITQQHMNNWEASKLIIQCIVFPVVNVPPPRYGWIYNKFFYDNKYDVIVGNFPGCSCVYFVKMLANSLGAHAAYV
jgi:hypothetical protein